VLLVGLALGFDAADRSAPFSILDTGLVRSTSTIKSYHVVTFARNGHPLTSRRRIPPAQQVQAVE